ncbi:MAG: DUF542 domain-containing protein [Peptostreptococcus sp.]|uniref:DUF542 domain-containing protein n=1 Tax=Peptostreptococcus sp. TaxID=1262 RepID=UPI002FCC516B
MINNKMTIAEAIKTNPDIVDVLSDVGIDYCCGGNRNLSEAIIEKNLELSSFIDLLNRQETKTNSYIQDAIKLGNEELIDYIIRVHHKKELNMIEKIDELMRKILKVHFYSHGKELTAIYHTFLDLKSALIPHFSQEEIVDFPNFLGGEAVDFDELIKEHEEVGKILRDLEELTNHYQAPDNACETYKHTFRLLKSLQDDIHQHVFLENSVLFVRS